MMRRQRITQIALFVTLLFGWLTVANAQETPKTVTKTPAEERATPHLPPIVPAPESRSNGSSDARQPRGGMVPLRKFPMLGDATFIPPDVPVRSLRGVTGLEKKVSRARLGGANGASVLEKIVNITQTTTDERVPVYSADERLFYFAGNQTSGRYGLFRTSADDPDESGPRTNERFSLTNPNDTRDYYFPAINQNQTRIAFVRSVDGKAIDDPTKQWNLYVSDMPEVLRGNNDPLRYIETAPLGRLNLRELTTNRDAANSEVPVTVPGPDGTPRAIINVGRPAWYGSTEVVFAAQLQGETAYHIFSVNIQTKRIFQLTAGAGDERNPQVSPDARYIAFDSNAVPNPGDIGATLTDTAYNNVGTRARTAGDLGNPTSAKNVGSTRNIFVMTPLGQNVRQVTLQYPNPPAVSSVQPTWSSANANNFTNPAGITYYIGFSSNRVPQFNAADTEQRTVTGWTTGPANARSIYYIVVSRNGGDNILGENDPNDINNIDADGARRLDTANDTLTGGIRNDVTRPRFRDEYPTFAPFVRVLRIGFQSNRNGDYLKDGFGSGFVVTGPTQNNIFVASVLDVTAPTLLRFDTSSPTGEVVHINTVPTAYNAQVQHDKFDPSLASSVRNRADGIVPGLNLFFTVRVEDREAGMRPEDSADGGAVYLQFKNPNSRYQSLQQSGPGSLTPVHRGEHKEFEGGTLAYIDGNFPVAFTNTATGYNVGNEYECQAISAAGALNTFTTDLSAIGTPYYSHRVNTIGPGPLYIAGVDDLSAYSGVAGRRINLGGGVTIDQLPVTPLDGGTYNVNLIDTQTGAVTTIPQTTQNVWLRLRPLVQLNPDGTPRRDGNGNTIPIRPADGRGGVLYGAEWTVPSEASDWYIDVIAYDNAVNPFNTAQRSNVIIYDNVWGFSSAPSISGLPQDILVVADYTLGQKFFTSRFGTPPTNDIFVRGNNLQPLFYGAESYYTDLDLQRFPSEQVGNAAPVTGTGAGIWDPVSPFVIFLTTAPAGVFGFNTSLNDLNRSGYPNVLGVSSYNDEALDSSGVDIDGYRLPVTGRYNIWRVLSRGPVPSALLQDYLPQLTTAPADTQRNETAPRNILVSNRMVVWAAPFTGNLFVGSGTLQDVQTQNDLTSYVQAGGRLLISGQDIGFALKGSGQSNFFFDTILKAQYLTDNAGTTSGIVGATYSGNTGYVNQLIRDPWDPSTGNHAYGAFVGGSPERQYRSLIDAAPGGNGQVRYVSNIGVNAEFVQDASLTANSTLGYVDQIRPNPGVTPAGLPAGTPPDAVDLFLYPNSPQTPAFAAPGTAPAPGTQVSAIIASSLPAGTSPIGRALPYDPARPFVPSGKVVYAAVGFESISQGWYNYGANNVTIRATLGRRAMLMHNITCWFRTGTITGRVVDNDGNAVGGVLVRAVFNAPNDTLPAAGTGITDDGGNFTIVGLEPGYYFIFGYRPGFYTQHSAGTIIHGGWRGTTNLALRRAGPGALTGVRTTTGQFPQGGVFTEDGNTPIPNIEIQVRRREPNGDFTLVTTLSSDGRTTTLSDGTEITLPVGAYLLPTLLIADYQVVANSRSTVVEGQIVPKQRDSATGQLPGVNENYGEVRVGVSPAALYRLGQGTQVITNPEPVGPSVRIRESETAQVDFLLPANPQRVRGRVVNQETNEGIAGAIVTAENAAGTLIADATTDADGFFVLRRTNAPTGEDPELITGGTYTLVAVATGFSETNPPSQLVEQQVTVGGIAPTIDLGTDPTRWFRLAPLPPGSVSGLVRRFTGANQPTETGVAGATITFFAVQTVGGVQIEATTPSFTITATEPTQVVDAYRFNFRQENVQPGTYNAYIARAGLVGNPVRVANIVVTSGQETRNVNFLLEPPQIYGEGIQLVSAPQNYAAIPTRDVFGLSETGDNNSDGQVTPADRTIYDVFNVAEWSGTQYNIGPDVRLRLGKGYFVRFGARAAVNAQGEITPQNSFQIDLTAGWNLIGHPFANQENPSAPSAPIDISSPGVTFTYVTTTGVQRAGVPLATAIADGAVQQNVYSYTGSTQGGGYQSETVLRPWRGYWFRAFVPVQMNLQYPGGVTRARKAGTVNGGKFKTITRAEQDQALPRSFESKSLSNWRLQLAARQGNFADTDNSIGVAQDAQDGFDNQYDSEKPPMMEEAGGVYLALKATSNDGRKANFNDDIRSVSNRKKVWEFTVKATGTDEVTVYWPNVGRLPRNVEPILVDVANGKRVALRGTSSYRFAPSGRAERSFQIELAPASSLPLDILNLRVTGRAFGGNYRFAYTTTRSVNVTAEVQTLTGKTVKQFASRATGGVETTISWDGRDEAGNTLPPGTYLLTLTARDDQGRAVSRRVPVATNQ